jgi:hypothetical protein
MAIRNEEGVVKTPSDATGAHCYIQYGDEQAYVFISFGKYDEQVSEVYDSFGHRDDTVFYHATPDEIPELMQPDNGNEWHIVEVDCWETGFGVNGDPDFVSRLTTRGDA